MSREAASTRGSRGPGANAASAMKCWALRSTRASCAATAPTAHAVCGTTCWSKVRLVVCTALSGSCESRHCVLDPVVVDCPRTGARAARWLTTCWTASSRPMARTRSGWPTSPTSGQQKVGCTWLRCWTCTRCGPDPVCRPSVRESGRTAGSPDVASRANGWGTGSPPTSAQPA